MKNNSINNGRDRLSNLVSLIENVVLEIIIQIKYINFYFFFNFSNRLNFLKKNISLKDILLNEKIFILGLGPSIKNYDIGKLRSKNIIMVNRSFNHPNYSELKPKFHLFIDNKLANGRWPISYIDRVLEKAPDVKIILNANWYYLEKFSKFRNNSQFYWIKFNNVSLLNGKYKHDITKIISVGGTVMEFAITLSIYLGSKDINIIGLEGNGLAKLMCNENSHWDGKDQDYEKHNSLLYANDMITSSRGIKQWHAMSKKIMKTDVKVFNLTKEGIFDAYEYKDFEKALND